jgi:methionyl-tRNA formyltransferase
MVGEVRPSVSAVLLSEVNSKFGAPILGDLIGHPNVEVVGLVTQPEGQLCTYYLGEPDPVDLSEQAVRAEVTVLRPSNVNDDQVLAALRRLDPDYLIIANFQQILRQPILQLPRQAVVNFHPSPLPRYAGLAPFFWMALNGERAGGVSAIITTTGIDDGPILASRSIPLTGRETAGEIRDSHFIESRRLLHDVLPRLVARDLDATPQDLGRRTYFSRPSDADVRVEWRWSTERIMRVVRACSPEPGALGATDCGIIRVHEARPWRSAVPAAAPGRMAIGSSGGLFISCRDGWLQLVRISWPSATALQPAGDGRLESPAWASLGELVEARRGPSA